MLYVFVWRAQAVIHNYDRKVAAVNWRAQKRHAGGCERKASRRRVRAQQRHAGGCVRNSVTQEEEEELVIEAVQFKGQYTPDNPPKSYPPKSSCRGRPLYAAGWGDVRCCLVYPKPHAQPHNGCLLVAMTQPHHQSRTNDWPQAPAADPSGGARVCHPRSVRSAIILVDT